MLTLELTKGFVATIDDEDADLAALKWTAKVHGRTVYARRNVYGDGKATTQYLHRVIAARMGIEGEVDHEDRDGLNCRRENLRPATRTQQLANRGRLTRNTSGFKGVSWTPWGWVAKQGKRRLGQFDDLIEAAKAYDRAALEAYGPFAVLNFPALPSPAPSAPSS